eukprot:m.294264 g.294264  ORF g.294264 m.294264 type:complete len:288 (-) comp19501_c13_seq4:2204-3067(-)
MDRTTLVSLAALLAILVLTHGPAAVAAKKKGATLKHGVSPPRRRWLPPEPRGPPMTDDGEEVVESEAFVLPDPNLKLQVITTTPSTLDEGRFERAVQVQGLSVIYTDLSFESLSNTIAGFADDANTVVLFIGDPNDVVLAAEAKEMLINFKLFEGDIVFAAQRRCRILCAANWPKVELGGRYLNPSLFMGYGPSVASLMKLVSPPTRALTLEAQLIGLYIDREARSELGKAAEPKRSAASFWFSTQAVNQEANPNTHARDWHAHTTNSNTPRHCAGHGVGGVSDTAW